MIPIQINGEVYYVSSTGSDEATGGQQEPFASFGHAVNMLNQGDTLYVRGGTYTEYLTLDLDATESAPVLISAFPGEHPVIDGSGFPSGDDWSGLISVSMSSHIRITGFSLQNSPGMGILAEQSSHVTIDNNRTFNTVSSGIGVWHCSDVIVDMNEVELACNDGSQECITVASCSLFIVSNNHVFNGGPGSNGGEGIDAKHSRIGQITGNVVHDNNRLGIYVDAWDEHTHSIDVNANISYRNDGAGIALSSENGGLLRNIRLTNNLCYENSVWGLVVSSWDDALTHLHPMQYIEILNNTFVYNAVDAGWGGGVTIENDQVDTLKFINNIVAWNGSFQVEGEYIQGKHAQISLSMMNNLVYGDLTYFAEIGDLNGIIADPKFADASMNDYRLSEDSPAIDAGATVDLYPTDLNGNNRITGNGIDIGAYEYDSTRVDEPGEEYPLFDEVQLYPAYPNPFGETLTIVIYSPENTPARLDIFDVNGRLVANLFATDLTIGEHQFSWNPEGLASGTYFIRMTTPQHIRKRKVTLMH
ncbi:MAG: T9SS type A sorting domain-containing protein [Candidatus Marinimicrobia bacterium]|nr:T9SS type A sorting domain-containing protein [Candidatus Neomarinimicrobiota bacterium]